MGKLAVNPVKEWSSGRFTLNPVLEWFLMGRFTVNPM